MLAKTTDYHPNVICKQGKAKANADALSRAISTDNSDPTEKSNDRGEVYQTGEVNQPQITIEKFTRVSDHLKLITQLLDERF